MFSIIIPFKTWSKDLDECLESIGRLTFSHFEVILVPDDTCEVPVLYQRLPIRVIVSGAVSPAIKRDLAAKDAVGTYLAFIDDDAYPEEDWLDVADRVFRLRTNIGAIGGPGITPKTDSFWARVSGAVFLSRLSGGFPERYLPCPPMRNVDDWPSVNLIVRSEVFSQVGGFDSRYWPGEDTKLCRDIIVHGWDIVYVPELIVHHHRRASLKKHLRQVGRYGYHRGLFVRLFPETSRKLVYFVPLLFVIFLITGTIGSFFYEPIRIMFMIGIVGYITVLLKALRDITRMEEVIIGVVSIPYIFMTHCWYGMKFFQGLWAKEYQSSLGK